MHKIIIFGITFLPSLALAQEFSLRTSTFKTTIGYVISVLDVVNPILIGLSFIVFFWGLSKFILHSGSPADVTKGKNYMIWSIGALFVLVAFATIIGLIASDLEIGPRDPNPRNPSGVLLETRAVAPSTSSRVITR